MTRNLVLLTISCMLLSSSLLRARAEEPPWQLASPDGKLAVTLALMKPEDKTAYPGDEVGLFYRIEHGAEGRRVEVLPWSPLGIVRDDADFTRGLTHQGAGRVREIDETYALAHGKQSKCRARAREQAVSFENADGKPLEVILRAADDGVAFRYRFPNDGDEPRTVVRETTGFRLPADSVAWMAPYSESTKYTPAYEEYYDRMKAGTRSPHEAGWALPALFRVPGDRWVLLTEAAADGTYCGCRLNREAPHRVYTIRFPDPEEGAGQGEVEPTSKLPWTTPWRVLMVADSLGGIVESTLVTDLNPPSRVEDTSWIEPGRVAWSWWSDHDSPQDYRKMTPFIDLAAEMGWEYFLVDANWTLMDHGNVRQLAEYAQRKGVKLFLWYNSGGEHNIVSEKPRGCMKAAELRDFEFKLLKEWGVAGVKIDFFQSDKQSIMGLYHDILRDAAEHRMMINFHGCTLPRGWGRTWPHLMTMEAVRGAECYTFAREFPRRAPAYNTILPFTRNVVGPMDYTPCAFTDDKYPHVTTVAHELALCVVFESGLLHFADRVSAYRDLPEGPKTFLREVPVAWHEIRFLAGQPGEYCALARRNGDAWYVGAINGVKEPRKLSVSLGFLGKGDYQGVLIADGDGPRRFRSQKLTVRSNGVLDLALLPYGGAAVCLRPKP